MLSAKRVMANATSAAAARRYRGAVVNHPVADNLRRAFATVLAEPLPPSFADLLRQLG
jgi:hypothetical protein